MPEYAEWTLDGCCGAGGKARGLVSAGHHVVGVDINPDLRDSYLRSGAHEFICADILDVLADPLFMARFTYADISPPCQAYSSMMNCQPPGVRARYPKLIRPVQPLLDAWGGPSAIENVEGARSELRGPVTYCMWMLGYETYRHRLIEAGGGLVLNPPQPGPAAWNPPTADHVQARTVRRNKSCGWPHPVPTERAGHWKPGCGKFVSVAGHERKEPVRAVMAIDEDWMPDREAVAEAIPPYLGFEIARQLAKWRKTGQETAA